MDHLCAKDMICLIKFMFLSKALPYIHTRRCTEWLKVVTGHPLRLLSSPVASWMQWHLNLARSLGVKRALFKAPDIHKFPIDDPF